MGKGRTDYLPIMLKNTETWVMLLKRVIYIACFVALCFIDQTIGSATGSVQYGIKNYTGVIIAIIILTSYKLKDFIKIPYLIWGVVFFVGRFFALDWARTHSGNFMEFNCLTWNVGIYGIVFIRMFYRFILERKKPNMNWPAFAVWSVMMIYMIIFGNGVAWPKAIMLSFACFYLTDFKVKDLNNLFTGMIEGIILGFLIIQGMACLYRPYDILRYQGMYSNSNMNALFYLSVYCAVLCKWYQMKLQKKHVLLRVSCVVLAAVLAVLTFFTQGRTAMIVMGVLTVFFLVFQALSRSRKRILEVITDGAAILIAIVLCFVPTYYLVRYIPALVDEPLYFEADSGTENIKVQKGEPIDSEKYIELEEVIEAGFGRILWFLGSDEEAQIEPDTAKTDWKQLFRPSMVAYAAESGDSIWYSEDEADLGEDFWNSEDDVDIAPGSDMEHPILNEQERKDTGKIRMAIYQVYLNRLQLTGHLEGQPDVWITSSGAPPHAHNVILQMAYDFGIPVGLLFIAMIFMLYNKVFFGITEKKQGARYYRLFVTLGFTSVLVLFGMLEINWIYGQLPFTMFFIVFYTVCHGEIRKRYL